MADETNNQLITYGAAFAGDLISQLVPGGGVFGKLADGYMAKRRQEAIDICLEELSKGEEEYVEADMEPFVVILLRYSKAVADGASKKNLRILAQIIGGLKRNKALSGDLFQRWAGIIEHMTRDELMLIGQAIIIQRSLEQSVQGGDDNFWTLLQETMMAGRYNPQELTALGASVSRYGLLVPVTAWDGILYAPGPWLKDLARLVDATTMTNGE
ncbi:hypothetical protein [Rhizobium leguminosarum]|uniref:hypothetical protein n=1 Tax=Rhizobium leguminosarum TaxID=384 RepID=UPI00103BB820|nr:hypothetical protein [Rhizobium leguminosarum]TBZ30759.1 hypothetical protein E0H44_35200 [Rhizobium leguminosarum bv. viciae]